MPSRQPPSVSSNTRIEIPQRAREEPEELTQRARQEPEQHISEDNIERMSFAQLKQLREPLLARKASLDQQREQLCASIGMVEEIMFERGMRERHQRLRGHRINECGATASPDGRRSEDQRRQISPRSTDARSERITDRRDRVAPATAIANHETLDYLELFVRRLQQRRQASQQSEDERAPSPTVPSPVPDLNAGENTLPPDETGINVTTHSVAPFDHKSDDVEADTSSIASEHWYDSFDDFGDSDDSGLQDSLHSTRPRSCRRRWSHHRLHPSRRELGESFPTY